jgi:hypothetical protein
MRFCSSNVYQKYSRKISGPLSRAYLSQCEQHCFVLYTRRLPLSPVCFKPVQVHITPSTTIRKLITNVKWATPHFTFSEEPWTYRLGSPWLLSGWPRTHPLVLIIASNFKQNWVSAQHQVSGLLIPSCSNNAYSVVPSEGLKSCLKTWSKWSSSSNGLHPITDTLMRIKQRHHRRCSLRPIPTTGTRGSRTTKGCVCRLSTFKAQHNSCPLGYIIGPSQG